LVAGHDSMPLSVGTPPSLVNGTCEAAIRAPTECTDNGVGRAVTRPRTEYLARLKLAAVVGTSLHVVLRCRTYASE